MSAAVVLYPACIYLLGTAYIEVLIFMTMELVDCFDRGAVDLWSLVYVCCLHAFGSERQNTPPVLAGTCAVLSSRSILLGVPAC